MQDSERNGSKLLVRKQLSVLLLKLFYCFIKNGFSYFLRRRFITSLLFCEAVLFLQQLLIKLSLLNYFTISALTPLSAKRNTSGPLASKDWYYGRLSREESDNLLNDFGVNGDFLVRDSESNVSTVTSFRFEVGGDGFQSSSRVVRKAASRKRSEVVR